MTPRRRATTSRPRSRKKPTPTVATIGYQLATVPSLIGALRKGRVVVLVDVRAVASSRRPGFSKSALAASLEEAGIQYVHLRGLGTPADGRAAARSGRHADLRRIFSAQLKTLAARDDLMNLTELVRSGRRTCLLCLEASPEHCHRSMVASALGDLIPIKLDHLSAIPPA